MKWLLPLGFVFVACSVEPVPVEVSEEPVVEEEIDHEAIEREAQDARTRDTLGGIGLVDLEAFDERILIYLKYASEDNFMHQQLYDTIRQLFIQKEVAVRLSAVQDYLDSLNPGYRLLVYDGVRPVQVQKEMWDALDSIPPLNRGKFVSNPALGSVHNFGAAVDLTIADKFGKPLDMGAGYDDFRPIAFPSKEAHFLKTGELSKQQWENRRLLRKVMRSQKFSNIPSEWWHFNAYSRITASHRYQLLDSESGSARWFKIVPKISDQEDSLTNPE